MKAAAASGDTHGFFRANNEFHRKIVLASGNAPDEVQIAVDCARPHELVQFWAAVMHYEVEGQDEDGQAFALELSIPRLRWLAFHTKQARPIFLTENLKTGHLVRSRQLRSIWRGTQRS